MNEQICEKCFWKNVHTKGCVKGQPIEIQRDPKDCDFYKKADSKVALKTVTSER